AGTARPDVCLLTQRDDKRSHERQSVKIRKLVQLLETKQDMWMKRVTGKLQISQLRSLTLATCLFTLPGLALAQDAQSRDIIEGIQDGERAELKLPDPEEQLPLEDLRKFTEV